MLTLFNSSRFGKLEGLILYSRDAHKSKHISELRAAQVTVYSRTMLA
jgi:hypothetical protein